MSIRSDALLSYLAHLAREAPSAGKSNDILCQNCVRYPLKPRSNTMVYGSTPMHIVVAGNC
jgi:hypothetical protein